MPWSLDMNEPSESPELLDDVPAPRLRRQRRLSFVWIVPALAGLLGIWLGLRTWLAKGPTVTITFQASEGIEAGHTKIKYKDVEVGRVTAVNLSPDLNRVVVTAEFSGRSASGLLSEHTRFWIVKPRIGTTGISGLNTLLSGSYISMDPGPPGASASEFKGLEAPPIVSSREAGELFSLRAEKLSSLNIGSPVYFRQIKVGEVAGYDLAKDGQSVQIKIFVHAPFNALVHKDTRFWDAGGVDVTVDANGLRMSSDSLMDILLGGIAFENPTSLDASEAVPKDFTFVLYPNHERSFEKVYLTRFYYVVDFNESVRGLTRGSPVEFRGIKIGSVEDLKLEFHTTTLEGHVPVLITIEPERLAMVGQKVGSMDVMMEKLVARGLRAQLKMGSLLMGGLFVDLDFYPQAPARALAKYGKYPQIPTIPTTMGALIGNLTQFLDHLQKLPLDQVIQDLHAAIPELRNTLKQASAMLARVDKETLPEAQATLAQTQKTLASLEAVLRSDSPAQQDLHQALEEFTRMSRTLRDLADTLERHPEALIKGKGKDQTP
jgi:paraquat-inducible protein B